MDIAKTTSIPLLCAAALCCGLASADDGDALYARNKALSREVAALRTRVNGLEDDCVRLAKTVQVLDTTCDLMTGKMRTPPELRETETVICRFETDAEKLIDNTATGEKAVTMRWLKGMKAGAKYRFACDIRCEDVKGCGDIKFGGFVPVQGSQTQWPAASVGIGTFGWRHVSFDYVLPAGASFCLIYGLEAGTGKVWVRDVTVSEVAE